MPLVVIKLDQRAIYLPFVATSGTDQRKDTGDCAKERTSSHPRIALNRTHRLSLANK